jgi:alpha-D-xyloside xylohydrolase
MLSPPRPRLERPLLTLAAFAASAAAFAQAPERLDDGVAVTVQGARLELRVCRDDVIRVLYSPDAGFFTRDSLMTVDRPCRETPWELQTGTDSVAVSTRKVTARVALPGGEVSFLDAEGRTLLAQKRGGGMTLTPALVQGEQTHHVQAQFEPVEGEGFYGLGQHQSGFMNYAGRDVDLYQHNIVAAVPFLASSRGYGVLWDNTSHTKFGDLRPPEAIPPAQLVDASGERGGLTGTYHQGGCDGPVVATRVDPGIELGAPEDRPALSEIHQAPQVDNAKLHPDLKPGDACVVWEGEIESLAAGEYDLIAFDNNGVRIWFDGELKVDTWRQGWLAWWDVIRVELAEKTRYRVRVEWNRNQGQGTLRLKWKTPPRSPYTSLWSEVGDGVDYYFVYGPSLDGVIAGYREITGRAPMMPRWAYGMWQCRERYESADQMLGVLAEMRKRGIPFDNIVQDWQYWESGKWGSHAFDATRFPDPEGWIRSIHEDHHARLMISVWPKFYRSTENFEELHARGFLYPETLKRPTTDWLGHVHTFYDAFDPGARELFWEQMNRDLFSKGVDAWWMDATEPELVGEGTPEALKATMNPTHLGTGSRMANAFALVNSQAVYEGQREVAPDQRVFILTRSAFAGMQRYASSTWSGDVSSDWASFRKQIPAGLNFSLSGIPYWTTDIGGFAVPPKWSSRDPKPEDEAEWRELVTRWFQFGTFCPLFRVHGQYPPREMWYFGDAGDATYDAQLAFDRLRYRLLPYIYSLGGGVTRRHDTIMRALVMDFPGDPQVLGIGDQYMFGPALLVSPVTRPGATSRPVYLPTGAGFYDFWTGEHVAGGRTLEAEAPLERLPVYVRAGSILPIGPELQYSDEKPADPLTLWVYQGADASFELYEDEGVTYGYEQGAFSTIPLLWDEAAETLTIGPRTGAFPGMLEERSIRVVFVSPGSPVPHGPEPEVARTLRYDGAPLTVRPEAASP